MPDDDEANVPQFRRTLTPDPSERTITLSHDQLLRLLDAFAGCAQALQHKLILLDDLYALLQRSDVGGVRKVLTQNKQREVAQILADLRVIRAEAEKQADEDSGYDG